MYERSSTGEIMKVYCMECKQPIEVNTSQIIDSYIPPDLCKCDNCNQENETDLGEKKGKVYYDRPKISYRELREKEQEEISRHRWFMSEKKGYDVGKDDSEADWRKNYENDFLKQWNYR
ncbi:MAG: hypothetical protein MUO43_08420 [Desulfobacterales bacterium]|nr:hypothetical protein [Desulfobacterales bacterium]